MKKLLTILSIVVMALTCVFGFAACTDDSENGENQNMKTTYQMKITVNDAELIAEMYDNSASAAIKEMLPMELDMLDLYGREMCYRFTQSLPTDDAHNSGYEVGEIVYYPPMHSFVIMYKQNGEHFQMQKIGKVKGSVSVFEGIGNIKVKFEIVEE